MNLSLQSAVRIINAGGVSALLILGIYLGLRGDVVTAEQLADCRMARDHYLVELLKRIPAEQLP